MRLLTSTPWSSTPGAVLIDGDQHPCRSPLKSGIARGDRPKPLEP